MWEEDFTEVGRWLKSLRATRVTDIRSYLENCPDEVEYGAGLIKILSVNPAGRRLVHAGRDKDVHTEIAGWWVTSSVHDSLVTQFEAIWNNVAHIEFDMTAADEAGHPKEVIVHWSAARIDGEMTWRP